MQCHPRFEWNRSNNYMTSTVDFELLRQFDVFTDLSFHGGCLHLWGNWSEHSELPLLGCRTDSPLPFELELGSSNKAVEKLLMDGWQYEPREGAFKHIYVDTLDKIAGLLTF